MQAASVQGLPSRWRRGRVSALLDGACLNRAASARPLVEVAYDDGEVELGVDQRQLHRRATAESHPQVFKGGFSVTIAWEPTSLSREPPAGPSCARALARRRRRRQ